jgi:type IV pilus assembly protein PilE
MRPINTVKLVDKARPSIHRGRRMSGFTLIELMVAAVVIGIVAAIAYPAYVSHISKSRRSDAKIALNALQLSEEKYRASNASYGTLANLGASSTSSGGYYTIAVSGLTATGYTLTATAATGSSQASDTGCTSMTLTYSNNTTTTSPATCWN